MATKLPTYPSMTNHGGDLFRELPSSWNTLRVKQLFKIRKDIAGTLGYPVWSVTQHGLREKDITSGDGQLSMDYSKYQFVRVGDLVMNHMDLITGGVDIGFREGVTSPDYRVFIPRFSGKVDKRYFVYLFRVCYWTKKFYSMGQGSAHLGRWRLPRLAFEGLVVPVPSQDEQKQIASFLDYETAKIDALIEKQQQLIALLGEKRQAVISHAVTKGLNPDAPMRDSGVEWLGEVPSHWTVCRLKHAFSFLTSGPRGWSDLITDDGASVFLQSGDLNDELGLRLDTAKRISPPSSAEGVRTKMQDGDVVCCVTGANTGRVAVATKLNQTVYVNQHLALIRPRLDLAHPRFLATLLAATPTRTYFAVKQYGLKEGLSLTNVAETPICLPPVSEQEDIVNYLDKAESKMRRLREIADDQVDLLQERRTALISAAVTGKIDVRGWKRPSAAPKKETEMEVA